MKTIFLFVSLMMMVGCKKIGTEVNSSPNFEQFAQQRDFLSHADKVIVYSTESFPVLENAVPAELFHGYKIMGSIEINDPKLITQIALDLEKNVYAGPGSAIVMCFNPRHGLRVFSGKSTRDYLLCFECLRLYIYENNTGDEHTRIQLDGEASSGLLNKIMDDHSVPREMLRE